MQSSITKAEIHAIGAPIGVLMGLIGWFLAGTVLAQTVPERVEKPAFKVGDYWVYNKLDGSNGKRLDVRTDAIAKLEASGYRVSKAEGYGTFLTTEVRNNDFNMFRTEGKDYLHTAKPAYPNYVFPLYIGKSWKQKVEQAWSTAADVSIVIDMETRVVGWEMVTVPAGNFIALKIESGGWYAGKNLGGGWTGKIKETIWFAPEVRNIVRHEYHDKIAGKTYDYYINELQTYGLAR